MLTGFLVGKPEKGNHLEDIVTDGSIIFAGF
jgi:hypothetical protein